MKAAEAVKLLQQKGLHPPRTLTLAITGACNLTCRHCWVESGGTDSAAHVPERTLRRIIGEFAEMDGEGIRLTGGEPLCHPAWSELLRVARSAGLEKIMLQTNAMLFDDAGVAALCELDFPGLSLQVSLDGATAAKHDLVRGEGALQAVMDGLRLLRRSGMAGRVSLFFTEMRHNLEDFPAILELAAELGVATVTSGTLVLGGRAAADSLVAPPGLDQYRRLLQRYAEEPRFREFYGSFGCMAALEWLKGEAPRTEGCTFAENPYLTPDGRLYPCLMCHADGFAVSGVPAKGLAAALAEGTPHWAFLARLSRRRADAIPACQKCPQTATCASGCLGRAWGSCGDFMAPDDRCELRRTIHHYRQQGTPA